MNDGAAISTGKPHRKWGKLSACLGRRDGRAIFGLLLLAFVFLVSADASPSSISKEEKGVSEDLTVLANPQKAQDDKIKALKSLRLSLTEAAFRDPDKPRMRIDHALAFKSLPQIIDLMTPSHESDSFVVVSLLQSSCPKPEKEIWQKWLDDHPTSDSIIWAWPDLNK